MVVPCRRCNSYLLCTLLIIVGFTTFELLVSVFLSLQHASYDDPGESDEEVISTQTHSDGT